MSILGSVLRHALGNRPAVPNSSVASETESLRTISGNYADLNHQLHAERPDYGTSGAQWATKVIELAREVGAKEVLDYGCGKQTLAAALVNSDLRVIGYDPAIPGLEGRPEPADMVVCTDVLEHVEPEFIDNVLDDIARCARRLALVTVATRPAIKTLADGRNAHLTVQPFSWWRSSFERRFTIVDVRELEGFEFALVLRALNASPMPADGDTSTAAGSDQPVAPGSISVLHVGKLQLRFNTPNAMTRWRVETIFKKEPDTIRWIAGFPAGSVLVDVGANVGMYSVIAAMTRGTQVFAFEPESQNYALLNANIAINSLSSQVSAFPLALSDTMQVDRLYLSEFSAGGSCHSFGEEVGFDLKPRSAAFAQGCFSVSLDQLVKSGAVPVPDYLKLDVDGIEHKVINGARETLANPKLKEVLVELNTHLPEHNQVISTLGELGLHHDPAQAQGALRKDGAFEGVGEFIFRRRPAPAVSPLQRTFQITPLHGRRHWQVLQHVLRQLDRAEVLTDPFPFAVIDEIFPEDYYAEMLAQFPSPDSLLPIGTTGRVTTDDYDDRHVVLFTEAGFARLTSAQLSFWQGVSEWMYSDLFLNAFVAKFHLALQPRLDKIVQLDGALRCKGDALLVSDRTNYAIGPHTDTDRRLVSFLFYLPADDSLRDLGTSLYRPKDPSFTCWGGDHHPFERFDLVKTVDFTPNRLVVFPKTERSFHGVEPIARQNVDRRLLINNIRVLNSVTH